MKGSDVLWVKYSVLITAEVTEVQRGERRRLRLRLARDRIKRRLELLLLLSEIF